LASATAVADVPARLAAQGVLRTDAGGPVADGKYPISFKLYESAQSPDAIWTEVHVAVAVTGGFFAVDLGGIDAKNPLPIETLGQKTEVWLGVQVSDNPEMPRVRWQSVPFAVRAQYADQATKALTADQATKALLADSANTAGYADQAGKADGLTKAITGDLILPGSLGAATVGFPYAGSTIKGGPALDLQCSGCVGLGELEPGVLAGSNVSVGGALKGSGASTVYAALVELFELWDKWKATLTVLPGQLGVGKAPADGCGLDVAGNTCAGGQPALWTRVAASQQELDAITTVGTFAWRSDVQRPFVRHPGGWRELLMKAVCGDGSVDVPEECDDGKNNADAPNKCRANCKKPICGDKIVDTGEQCDDGNSLDGDGCLTTCKTATCGDGIIQLGVEVCDGAALAGQSCVSQGLLGGILACAADCKSFNKSACTAPADTSWMLKTDNCGGFRQSTFNTKVRYAVSASTTWDPNKKYDCPDGYHWASTAEGNAIFGSNGNSSPPHVYYAQCGWNGYSWAGADRYYFRFSDSKTTNAYKHAGNYDMYQLQNTTDTNNFGGIVCIQN
jgi:cysteine-rich repeat protein